MTDAATSEQRREYALAVLRSMAVTIFHDRPTISVQRGQQYALEACQILRIPTEDVPPAELAAVFREEWARAHPHG